MARKAARRRVRRVQTCRATILSVDADKRFARRLSAILAARFNVEALETAEEAADLVSSIEFDCVLLDLDFGSGRMDVFEFLDRAGRSLASAPVIVATRFREMDMIVRAVRMGAYGYYVKESELSELDILLERALEWKRLRKEHSTLRARLSALEGSRVLGRAKTFTAAVEQAEAVAKTKATVLLTGESGTGKTLMARWIHEQSCRQEPFVHVHCPAIPDGLIESELFGYARGAFTGAIKGGKRYTVPLQSWTG